mmetsp:Transcript_8046/g.26935  ORF Transcript_8046/g.26935 Transcript_8046/m.26935 type:complete len:413 (-) Transcript_8046:1336-2574(-)
MRRTVTLITLYLLGYVQEGHTFPMTSSFAPSCTNDRTHPTCFSARVNICKQSRRHQYSGVKPGVLYQRMLDESGEWFNADLVAKMNLKNRSPPASKPILSSGTLGWGWYSAMSTEGKGKGTQVGGSSNQDSMAAVSLGTMDLFGIFDGHGEFGHKVSAYVANNLPDQIRKRVPDIERAGMDEGRATPPLQEAFRETHQSLLEQKKFDTFLSGSTCIVVLVAGEANQKRIIVANAGDCRCIVCTEGWGGKLITTQISVDQSPDRPDERKRIEKNGGIVGMVDVTLDKPVVISVEAAAKKGADLGPARVFWPDGSWEPPFDSCFPGLAMSRSLGDSVLDDLGVFPDPEVYTRAVKPKDRFLVIASDGVWQVMSNEEVSAVVNSCNGDADQACKAIYDRAAQKWEAEEHEGDGFG